MHKDKGTAILQQIQARAPALLRFIDQPPYAIMNINIDYLKDALRFPITGDRKNIRTAIILFMSAYPQERALAINAVDSDDRQCALPEEWIKFIHELVKKTHFCSLLLFEAKTTLDDKLSSVLKEKQTIIETQAQLQKIKSEMKEAEEKKAFFLFFQMSTSWIDHEHKFSDSITHFFKYEKVKLTIQPIKVYFSNPTGCYILYDASVNCFFIFLIDKLIHIFNFPKEMWGLPITELWKSIGKKSLFQFLSCVKQYNSNQLIWSPESKQFEDLTIFSPDHQFLEKTALQTSLQQIEQQLASATAKQEELDLELQLGNQYIQEAKQQISQQLSLSPEPDAKKMQIMCSVKDEIELELTTELDQALVNLPQDREKQATLIADLKKQKAMMDAQLTLIDQRITLTQSSVNLFKRKSPSGQAPESPAINKKLR